MKRRITFSLIVLVLLIIGALGFILITNDKSNSTNESAKKTSISSSKEAAKKKDLPDAKQSDWDLVLVSRKSPKDEMNPTLATVNGIQVDQRIASAVQQFLAAAQQISPAEHLISGYRSVSYQEGLYQSYVQAEMNGQGTVNSSGKPISEEEAIKNVQTYSQPPRSSEHQTGLAIDMSNIDSLNESQYAKQIAEIAPKYGFVLRFPEGKKAETGIGYEDWHFRYVGLENAKYMTEHNLTLEEYLKLLPA